MKYNEKIVIVSVLIFSVIMFCLSCYLSMKKMDTKTDSSKRNILIEYRSKYGNNWDSWDKETVKQFKNEMESAIN